MVSDVHPNNPVIDFTAQEVEQSIRERFERQVDKYPDRMVFGDDHGELSYAELNSLANRWAHALLERRGAGADVIALLFEPGAAMLAALFAVLKTGKILLPLDPAYPDARIHTILQDAQANLVITDSKHLAQARTLAGDVYPLLNVDDLAVGGNESNIDIPIAPDVLAYIVYTSGSTGRPKGIVQNQRNVLHAARTHTNALHISADDRLSMLSSYSHLAGITSIFRAALNGAALFPLNLRRVELAALAAWLIKQEITLYQSVPTVFRHFMKTLNGTEQFPRLRLIHLGGEPLYRHDVDNYRKHFSQECILLNNLGSTEVGSYRQYFIGMHTRIDGELAPVGYAVADKDVFLLDENGKEVVSPGCSGEITVKSHYLAVGYWRDPDLTNASFLPDPDDEGQRIFRTGDIGEWHGDGCLVHLGRKDAQIKIRGQRVEIAEIEAALLSLPSIHAATLTAHQDAHGEQSLAAYIILDQGSAIGLDSVRSLLRETLPEFMIPSIFVTLDALPLTPNGKVDYRALPPPGSSGHAPSPKTCAATSTYTETALRGIWAEVFNNDNIGIYDNFFALGGHSLLATQIISRIANTFDISIAMRTLFDAPTIAEFAPIVEQLASEQWSN